MILLVNQHVVPVFSDIAIAFAATGKQVTLFTGFIEPGSKQLPPSIRIKKSIPYNRKTLLSRSFTWLIFSIHYFLFLIVSQKPEKLLVTTNPPLTLWLTAKVASLKNIQFYNLVYDLYPEVLSQVGLISGDSWMFQFWQQVNRGVFSEAQMNFTLSDSMKAAMSKYVNEGQIHVIYNWADVDYIYPISKDENAFVKSQGWNDKMIVMYAGNMGLTHDLESVAEAAALLHSHNEILFVFVGSGVKRDNIQQICDRKKLRNVVFLPYQDASIFPKLITAADIAVVTLGAGAEGISVPSKTYVNMAAGACLLAIAPEDSELTRIVNNFQVGVACVPHQPEAIARKIVELMKDKKRLKELKENARHCSLQFTSRNAQKYVKAVYSNTSAI